MNIRVEQVELHGKSAPFADAAPPAYVKTDTISVTNSPPATVHCSLHARASAVELTSAGTGGSGSSTASAVYVAFGSPGDPTAEPRYLLPLGAKRTLTVPAGNDIAFIATSDF